MPLRAAGGELHYCGCGRWVPHGKVSAIACGDNVAYIATDRGLGIVPFEPCTLQKKATVEEYMQQTRDHIIDNGRVLRCLDGPPADCLLKPFTVPSLYRGSVVR